MLDQGPYQVAYGCLGMKDDSKQRFRMSQLIRLAAGWNIRVGRNIRVDFSKKWPKKAEPPLGSN